MYFDYPSIALGYVIFMICDVLFYGVYYLNERAMYYRRKNKKIKEKEMEKSNES